MLHFYAKSFLVMSSAVARLQTGIATVNDQHHLFSTSAGPPVEGGVQVVDILRETLRRLERECHKLPLSSSLLKQIERAKERVSLASMWEASAAVATLKEIENNIHHELESILFLVITEDNARLMNEPEPFGSAVGSVFSAAASDVRAATRCFALEEWTACVFHCMRALEHGIRRLAAEVGMTMTPEIELENWRNLIDQIEKAIRKLDDALPKSAEKSEKLKRYSDAASQFRYFKDAWRNHVSHSRASYDKSDAERVWNHTKEFMSALAAWA